MAVGDSPLDLAASNGALPPADLGAVDDGAAPGPDQGAAGGPGGATPAQGAAVGELLAKAMAPMVSAFQQEIGQLRSELNQMKDGQARQPQQPTGPTDVEGARKAKLERFVSDPDAYEAELQQRTEERVLQRLAPFVAGPGMATQESTLSAERARIDGRFGPGTFDEEVMPHLQSSFSQKGMEAHRFNPDAIRTAVAALVGSAQLQPKLDTRQSAFQAQRAKEQQAKRQEPPNFLGSNRGRVDGGGQPVISPEDRLVMDAVERSGYSYSEGDLRSLRSIPRSADGKLPDFDTMLALTEKKNA